MDTINSSDIQKDIVSQKSRLNALLVLHNTQQRTGEEYVQILQEMDVALPLLMGSSMYLQNLIDCNDSNVLDLATLEDSLVLDKRSW
jgi:hypothetical protein